MADDGSGGYCTGFTLSGTLSNTFSIKKKEVQVLQGGAVVEVINTEQAKIAEDAGASSVLIVEPLNPRMSDPYLIKEVKKVVSIPVIARVRIGHSVEAQILEAIGIDVIDESEFLDDADDDYINKQGFHVPFVCGCESVKEVLIRITEGASAVRVQGSSSRSVFGTAKALRSISQKLKMLMNMDEDAVLEFTKEMGAPYELVTLTKRIGRLPVLQLAAGDIRNPADATLLMQLGCDGVIVDHSIFNHSNPHERVSAVVQAVKHHGDPRVLEKASCWFEGDDGVLEDMS